jgi:predicted transcriptional regulator
MCYIPVMANVEPTLFDEIDDAAEQRALEEAERAIVEGRTISHAAVRRWLLSWGTPDELPPPKCGE